MSASFNVLDDFDGTDGKYPAASLIADANGDLLGTTGSGGTNNDGAVFEITYSAEIGYASTPTVLVNFDGVDGSALEGGLLADNAGDLFGTTEHGGANGYGTAFEIAKTAGGYATAPTVLASFGTNALPRSGLIADANGDLFGVTGQDGTHSDGTIFEIAKTASGYVATPTVLVNFNGAAGDFPIGGLLADAAGDLFGTTDEGGANGNGTAFEIAKTAGGYASTPTVLVNFGANTGGLFGSLIADAEGDLFGTSGDGGAYSGGAVFEIAKTASGYASTPTVLASFNGPVAHSGPELGTDGSYPVGNLTINANGDVFGTTEYGGAIGDGTVFEIAKTADGYATSPTSLYSFMGTEGAVPAGGLVAGANGDLVGTTELGGTNGDGTVFEVAPGGGPEVFSQVQAAAGGPLAGDYLWSNAANWTDGVPLNGDTAASHSAGIDDVAPLTGLNSLDLSNGGTVKAEQALTVGILTGDKSSELLADSVLAGSATADIVRVGTLAATGGTYGAVGPNAVFIDGSASSPGNVAYSAGNGGMLEVTNDLTIGDTAAGNLIAQTGGQVTSVNGNVGTGVANKGNATVDGVGSSWTMTGALTIGVQGGAGSPSLTVSNHGSVVTSTDAASYDYMPNGSLVLETGGALTETSLDMHDAASLTVESGATLTETGSSSQDGAAGVLEGLAVDGTATFDGGDIASPNAFTEIAFLTKLGGAGSGTVTASDGAVVNTLATAIGLTAGDNGTLVVTGSGTDWTGSGNETLDSNEGGLNVGASGSGSLTVEAGAAVSNPLSYIKVGQFPGGSGTALVTGNGSTLSAGGLLRIGDSGQGTLTVTDGGAVTAGQGQVGDYGNSVGLLEIDSGGTVTTNAASTVDVGAQKVANNGTIQVAAGSFDIGVQGGSQGHVDVDGGTLTVQGDLTVGNAGAATLSVENGGVVSVVNADIGTGAGVGKVTLGVGGLLTAASVHVGAQGGVAMAGGVLDPPDQVTIDAAGAVYGFGTATGSIDDNGNITAEGGTLDLTGDVSGSGALSFTTQATLQLAGTITNTAGIVFTGSGEALVLGSGAEVKATVSGLGVGDSIALAGRAVTSAIYDPDNSQLTITGSDGAVLTLTFAGLYYQSDFAVADNEVTIACFLSGTRMATARGNVRVENLAIGDMMQTSFSGLARVNWIGHRQINCRTHPNPSKVWPVRVRAGAFADGLPCRDLRLSPDHAVLVDDVLIPVRHLINGSTIAQEACDQVTYHHVELERHDAIFAEGLPCESYLDTGNRSSFWGEGTPVVVHADFNAWTWEARGCARLVITGAVLEAVQRRLQARADDEFGACRQAA